MPLMKPLFIFLFVIGTNGLFAYQAAENWYPGKIKLKEGAELIGDIQYDLSRQTARIRINGEVTTLQENQLTSMLIFTEDFWHEFQNVALKNEQGEVSSTFARLIYRSPKKFSLYKEYFAVSEDFDVNPATGVQSIKEQPADFKKDVFMPNPKFGIRMGSRLFLVDSEGNSQSITEKGLSEAYGSCIEKIKNFINRNRLTVRKESHVVRIVRYADSQVRGCSNE